MTGISYFFIHLLALSLPGLIIVRLFRFQAARYLLVVAYSYIYYAVLAILAKSLGFSINTFLITYVTLLLVFAIAALMPRATSRAPPLDRHWLTGMAVVFLAYSVYRYLIGPYNEIPADLYRHLEYARIQLNAIGNGHLGTLHDIKAMLKQQGAIWYSFYALINYLTGLAFSQTFPWATYANNLIFLSSVFSLGWYLFARFQLAQKQRLFAALLATFFVASHLGLNVFSYIRYYSFAPTMLNMTIYFAAIAVICELFKWQEKQLSYALFLLLALFTTMSIHSQEALFILLMGGMMLAWHAFLPQRAALEINRYFPVHHIRAYRLLFLAFCLGFVALLVWTNTQHAMPIKLANKIIPLSGQNSFLNRVLFLNPGYQGIQVITLWGVAVYALFILYWRKFVIHPYLFAGMLLPFATVFNPVFVDWFIKIEGVHTLWRMLYIVPIHFVAAILVVQLLASASASQQKWKNALSYLAVTGLFVLLLPIPGLNPNSRLTLASVDQDEGYPYWQDLIDYLNQKEIEATFILTDPVTGYVLSGLSKHRTFQYKFFPLNMRQINFENYDNAPLKRYQNWLLVINDRIGGNSETGEASLHWQKNILDTAAFYSPALRAHIQNNPEHRFKLLWERDRIHVYLIQ